MEGLSIGSSNNLRKEILITSTPFTNQGGKERLRWKHLSPRFNCKRRLNGSLGRFTPNNQAQGDKALDYSPKATIKAQTEAKSITFITIPDSNSDEECKDNSQNRTLFTSLGEKEDCRRKDSSYFVKSKRRRLNNNFNRSPTSGNQVQGNSAFNYSPKATIKAQTAAKSITYITISDNSSDEECKNNNQNPSNRALIKAKKECKQSDNAKKYEQLTSGIPNDTFLNQSSKSSKSKSFESYYFHEHYVTFRNNTPESALRIEYLRLHLKYEIAILINQHDCKILFEKMDKKDCPYAFICHHQIKIQCNPLNKETILNKIYEILHSITVRKDHFISKSSKLGRFLISGQSQMKLKHLLDLNSCLAIALDENHRSRSNTQRININLLLGTIEKEGAKNADVIVNSISLRNYASGAIAKALYTAGGKQYHSECKTQLDSLGAEDIGSTSGSFFGCKKVYHIPFLSSCKSISWLKDKLKCCLEKANKESMKSIAIPAIGIGKIGLQIDQVIPGMFDVISNYSHQHKNNTSLKTVYFVTLPTQTDHHRQFRALLRDRNDSLIGQQDQLIATSDTKECPDNTVTATISAAIPFNQIHDHKTIPLVTKSSNSNVVHKSNLSYELYFTVHCYNESKCKLFRVNLYHGNIMGATTKSILDMTALCDQHRQLKTLDGIMESNSPQHTLKTLQYLPNFHSNYNLYQICPYGCLTGVNQLLKSISTYGDQSVSLPLPGIEFNEEHTYQIFKAIELFLTNNDHNGNRLDCIDFALGSKDRVEEIATWIREEITKSRFKLRWEITFNRTKQQNGFKIIYVSKFFTKMNQLQSIINEYGQSWGSFEIADDDYFIHVDKNRWHQISLEFWCQYNTILVGYNQNKMIRIHGYECDILKAISAIHKLFASRLKEKSDIEVQEVIAKNIPWYAVIDQSKVQFDSKLNYEIVKNYEIYCHNKTKMIFNVDSGRKSIDYKEMIITVDGKQYPIGQFASSCKDIAVPPHWDTADGITDGYYRTFDVTNPKERNEISLLLGNHQILRLTRIQNWNLYRRYQIMKKEVESTVQKYQPGTQVERKLFHGTTTANTDIICRKGFDRDFSGKSRGSALGTGTYFAISATTSLSYGKTLIIARVLTGVYANAGCSNKPNLSIIPGSNSERIHSVVDNMNNPSVFVVSNDNSAYPEYIVHV